VVDPSQVMPFFRSKDEHFAAAMAMPPSVLWAPHTRVCVAA
jgi:hypothetical protein